GPVARTRQEKSVVLPAPFGPMTPKISPGKTAKSTPASASRAPYRLRSLRTPRMGEASAGTGHRPREDASARPPQAAQKAQEPLRLEEHYGDQHRAVEKEIGVPQRGAREKLDLQVPEEQGPEDRSRDRAEAADDRHQDDREGETEIEDRAGGDVLEVDREEAPGDGDDRRG